MVNYNELLKIYNQNSRNKNTFKNKTGVSNKTVEEYMKENEVADRYFINPKTQKAIAVNIKKTNPFDVRKKNGISILRSWGVNRLSKKSVIEGSVSKNNKVIIVKGDVEHTIRVIADLWVNPSDELLHRRKTFIIKTTIKKFNNDEWEEDLLDEVRSYVDSFGVGEIEQNNVIKRLLGTLKYDNKYWTNTPNGGYEFTKKKGVVGYHIIKQNKKDGDALKIDDYIVKEIDYYKIDNIWNNVLELPQYTGDDKDKINCVIISLIDRLGKTINPNIIKKFFNGGSKGETLGKLHEFCCIHDIKYILYDIKGNVKKSHMPTKKTNHKSLILIAYNGHIFIIDSKTLNKVSIPKETVICNTDKKFADLIDEKIIPNNIRIFNNYKGEYDNNYSRKKYVKIASFEHDGKIYIDNSEYDVCNEILKTFGLDDKINPYTKLSNIIDIILPLYTNNDMPPVKSFFPVRIPKPGFTYLNDKLFDKCTEKTKLMTIDKNKCFSYCLKMIKYLIHVDYRQAKVIKHTKSPKELKSHHLYVAHPDVPNILLPNNDIYTGYHLIYASDHGYAFTVTEEIETSTTPNYYSKLIDDVYDKLNDKFNKKHQKLIDEIINKIPDDKVSEKNRTQKLLKNLGKSILNTHIGKMQQEPGIYDSTKISKMATLTEMNSDMTDEQVCYEYNNKLAYTLEEGKTITNIYNNVPISIQIKDFARILLFEKMTELELKDDDVLFINTDSITFLADSIDTSKLSFGNGLSDWKQEEKPWKKLYEQLQQHADAHVNKNEVSLFVDAVDNNELWNCYAGAGKSHYIKNKLIPSLSPNEEYLVVTPSHNTAKDYYRLEYNCKVIQTFNYAPILPKEDVIIVDEFGLCDKKAHDFLYKCMITGKRICAFGDFKQLLPVGESKHFNSDQYINMMFNKTHSMNTNHRNNFTKAYYDSLIDGSVHIDNEIKKHVTDKYYDADIIICKTNKECDKYNKLMAKRLKVDFTERKNGDILRFEPRKGLKIICVTNDLRDIGIYNNFDFVISKVKGDIIILDDNTVITQKQLNKYFRLGYAITSYKAQGQEFESIYVPLKSYPGEDTRLAYTLISRLKQQKKL